MDMKIYYDSDARKQCRKYFGLMLINLFLLPVFAVITVFINDAYVQVIDDLDDVWVAAVLICWLFLGAISSSMFQRKSNEVGVRASFVLCSGQIYCEPMADSLNLYPPIQRNTYRCYVTAYRIASGELAAPPPSMRKGEKRLVQRIMAKGENQIGKEKRTLFVEQMSNISLMPIPSVGYEVEYTARFGNRFAPIPTRVTINPNYTDYDELVSLLEGFAK